MSKILYSYGGTEPTKVTQEEHSTLIHNAFVLWNEGSLPTTEMIRAMFEEIRLLTKELDNDRS